MIRINLLAPERPAEKKKKAAAAPRLPGALQAYLLLGALRRRRRLALRRRAGGCKTAQLSDLDAQIAGRREAPARPAGDQDPGRRVPGEEDAAREQGQPHRAAEGRAEGPRPHAGRDLEGAARLRLAHGPRRDRRQREVHRGRATASPRSPTSSSAPPAQRLVPAASTSSRARRATTSCTFNLAGHLQEPRGRRAEKAAGRRRRRRRQRQPRSGARSRRRRRTAHGRQRLTKLPLAGQLGVVRRSSPPSSAAASTTSGTPMLEEEKHEDRRSWRRCSSEIRALEVDRQQAARSSSARCSCSRRKLETLKRILPAEKETPDLMRKVQYLAAQSSLMIKKFTPAADGRPRSSTRRCPINVDVEGTYHNLGLFFDRVSRLLAARQRRRTSRSRRRPTRPASNTIAASGVATTYVYVDRRRPAPGARGPGRAGEPGSR